MGAKEGKGALICSVFWFPWCKSPDMARLISNNNGLTTSLQDSPKFNNWLSEANMGIIVDYEPKPSLKHLTWIISMNSHTTLGSCDYESIL